MSPEIAALKAAIDRAVRERVERENASLRLCASCSMPQSDWTPTCRTCWDRHYRWETRRNGCPYPDDPVLRAHVRVVSRDLKVDRDRVWAMVGQIALQTLRDAA